MRAYLRLTFIDAKSIHPKKHARKHKLQNTNMYYTQTQAAPLLFASPVYACVHTHLYRYIFMSVNIHVHTHMCVYLHTHTQARREATEHVLHSMGAKGLQNLCKHFALRVPDNGGKKGFFF